jgi:hypothetical protein
LNVYPEVELLDDVVILFLRFWRTSILFSKMAVLIYIPTRSVQVFPSPHVLTHTAVNLSLWLWVTFPWGWGVGTFSHTHWPFICLCEKCLPRSFSCSNQMMFLFLVELFGFLVYPGFNP